MRTNLPVTDVEYPITDETLIVSKTDLKGKLTYFNDQFVDASGFTEQELMGQPHNIIRHPDFRKLLRISGRRSRPANRGPAR